MPVESCRFGPVEVQFDETVLRPRLWTLAQSEWAAELAGQAPPGPILELCAGAGHIGLVAAVGTDRPLVQVDKNPRACAFARANADAAGIGGRVDVRCASLRDALAPDERFGVVIADPPYIPTDEVASFPDDPVLAIDGGTDGLGLVAECLTVASAHLLPGGDVVLQVRGERQAGALASLCPDLAVIEVRSCGPDRTLVRLAGAATRRSSARPS